MSYPEMSSHAYIRPTTQPRAIKSLPILLTRYWVRLTLSSLTQSIQFILNGLNLLVAYQDKTDCLAKVLCTRSDEELDIMFVRLVRQLQLKQI